ncbi:la-related protein 7 isoform X3 [Zootermopsis nevadensis]|uniref:la-related protein 7 isoform X3 n=1 Tax=Zootermopsis nevadensis TaxID=136037 RepID=UPI000B8EBF12|nr:la-related protein 7 isoform X3 [Zootermopsis nevadensis]
MLFLTPCKMEEENPAIVECNQGDGEVSLKKVRHRKKQLYKSIRKQMEFYFGDANLTKDRFLGSLVMQDPYIDISVFLCFNRIRALTTNFRDIADALRDSELLSVTEDGTKVFRKTPIKEKENIDDCTVYVEQLPPDAQHDWLRDVFSAYGNVAYVSLPKYRNSGKIKGFAFVEFDTPEEANKTLEAFGARGCRLSSQIAPEKLCSISTYDPDEGKSENVLGESDKGTLEKINEDEDGQLQEKLLKKRRKRKKGKYEQGMEMSAEESEAVETERETESDVCLKKNKREKIHESEAVKIEMETIHSQSEDDNTPPKKRKRKKSEGSRVEKTEHQTDDTEIFLEKKIKTQVNTQHTQSEDDNTHPEKKKRKKNEGFGVEGTERKMDTAQEDTSTVYQSDDTETFLERKKQKRKIVDVEETDVSELQQGVSGVECENEEVGKKMKIKSGQWDEDADDDAEETTEEGAKAIAKKKTRKRKKHKKDKQEAEVSRLQILSKREWKRLRNKYLDLQKAKMKCLKQYLNRNQWNRNSHVHHHDQLHNANGQNQGKDDYGDGGSEIQSSVKQETEKKPKFTFTPGVIVHALLDEPISEVRKFKVNAKALGEVEYVDVIMGSNEAFLRCSTPTAAEMLVSNAPWQQVAILKGEDEAQYWNKMFRDREQKLSSNIRVKQRGRDKILKRAEKELGKHIRFDD